MARTGGMMPSSRYELPGSGSVGNFTAPAPPGTRMARRWSRRSGIGHGGRGDRGVIGSTPMPSQRHEALLELFRNRPGLAAELLRDALGIELPEYTEARIDSAELSEVQPAADRPTWWCCPTTAHRCWASWCRDPQSSAVAVRKATAVPALRHRPPALRPKLQSRPEGRRSRAIVLMYCI